MSAQVLYVEDHFDTCVLVQTWLGLHGHVVTTVPTVAEALGLVEQNRFNIYILDNWLPDGSGIELCRKLRLLDTTTPVLFLSGAAYPADIAEAMAAGAQGYLTKPVALQALSSSISQLLGPAGADLSEVTTVSLGRMAPQN